VFYPWTQAIVTTGQSLPSTPPNQAVFLINFPNGTDAQCTLVADGGSAFHLQGKFGERLPDQSAGAGSHGPIGGNETTTIMFTSATTPSTGSGSPAGQDGAGWRLLGTYEVVGPNGNVGNIYQGLGCFVRQVPVVKGSPYFKRYLVYEAGQTFSDFAQNDNVQVQYSVLANRSAQMGALYSTFFGLFAAAGITDYVCHYADIQFAGGQSQWGLLENTYQPSFATVPKYQAYMSLAGPVASPVNYTLMGQSWT
jgi:hypothetical protein